MPARLFLILLFVSSTSKSFAQQTACVDSSTVFLLQAGNSRISIQRSIVLADSGIFIAGTIREATVTDTSLFIARLDKFNNILFSKKLTGIKGSTWKLLQCNNTDILMAVTEYNPQLINIPHLFRFTINGNIIWQKALQENITMQPVNGGVRNFEITEASDNNFYIGLTYDIETDYQQSIITSYYNVYKISSNGNIAWKAALIQNESIGSIINAIKAVNNEVLIVTQQYYSGTQFCNVTNHKSIGLVKLNQATGAYISSKYYCLNFSGTGCLGVFDFYRNSVQVLPNGKIVISGLISTCDARPLFTIETDYNFSNPKCYRYNNIFPYSTSGNIVVNQFGEIALFARGFSDLNFLYAKLLPDGTIIMQRKMEMPADIVLSPGSFSPAFKTTNDFLFYVNQQQSNEEYLRVIEFKGNNVEMSDCTGKDTSFITNQSHTIVPIARNWDTIRIETPPIFNTNISLSDFSFQRQEVCSSISICDSLKIIGPDTICLSNPIQQFIANRNPGCLKVPQWKIDTSAIQSTQIINDTTVSITFKRSWQGYLYAYSSSCNKLFDSLYIKIIPAALPVQLGKDTTYCNPVVLDAGDNFASYKWQNGSSGRYLNVDSGGIYYVSVRDFCGNSFSDTIRFSTPPTNLFIGNDTCTKQFPFLITPNSGFKYYQWQNGSTNSQYIATVPGFYYVNATNGCNSNYSDSIMIYQAVQPFSLGKDTTLCGQQIMLSAPLGYTAYLWQNNSTGNNIVVNDTGYFFVRVTDNCGNTFIDTIRIDPLNLYFSAGRDTVTICKEESIQLAASTGFTNYLWRSNYNITDANKREVWVKPEISTKYIASAEKGPGCTVSDTVFVLVKDCPTNFFVPSAFTPNDDRLNDFFGPVATAPLQHYEFRIYNRWGQQIFYSNNIQKGWDGKLKGNKQNPGVFVWRCVYKFFNGPELSKKGSFVLIR